MIEPDRMCSLVYLAGVAPTKLANELITAGYQVWVALSVSEVLHLCEHERIGVIVIAPGMQDEAILPLKVKQITISPETHTMAKELIC